LRSSVPWRRPSRPGRTPGWTGRAPRARPGRRASGSRLPSSRGPGVVAGAVEVDGHDRLVSDHPGVVPARQRGEVAGFRDEFRPTVEPDADAAADVVLEVGRLAAVRRRDRLHVVRPAPARLQDEPSHGRSAERQHLYPAVRELTDLLRLREGLVLGLMRGSHSEPPQVASFAVIYLPVGRLSRFEVSETMSR